MKLIEMVCSGNNGRSPVMKLLAKRRLNEIGAANYCVDSSGTYVDKINKLDFSREEMIPTIILALRKGIYEADERRALNCFLRFQEGELLTYFQKALFTLMHEEQSYRTTMLINLGFNPDDVQPPKQTTAREEVVAVVTADQDNAIRARDIYIKSEVFPVPLIASISELAGMPEILPVTNRFDFGIYSAIINQLAIRTPKAIDEVVRILHLKSLL